MSGWWSGSATSFLALTPPSLRDGLAAEAARRFRINEQAQLRAWERSIEILQAALRGREGDWRVVLEFSIVRLGVRADAVLVCPHGIVVLEFKIGAARHDNAARRQVEDYAVDLQDFHAGSRLRPIVPVLLAEHGHVPLPSLPLLIGGATTTLDATPDTLGPLVEALASRFPMPLSPINTDVWEHAPYRPVPGIIDAARHLFARHDVTDIASARADATNLTLTLEAITRLIADARAARDKLVIFVTGIPGAGKTLCGLGVTFARDENDCPGSAAFLTGNPTLVHVLREALVRDAVRAGMARDAARQRTGGFIQELPRFRDDNVGRSTPPAERVLVIDEAQRSWTAAQAIAKTRDRRIRLDRSEPAILLDVMDRHDGFACLVCLVGNGQEIHDGEGGLAEWSLALNERPAWQIAASPDTLADPRPRSRLARLPNLQVVACLHLTVPVRAVRHASTPDWVDAVLRGDVDGARRIADAAPLPFVLTRDVADWRNRLRAATGEGQRVGLIASAGAKRLRAEGLGCELDHMHANAVAHWFLNSWLRDRDVRASDALELITTQFSIQDLELDQVGLAWDADLLRGPDGWLVRRFAGKSWQVVRSAEKIDNVLNTYRVLLTRARYGTVIFVPRGDERDPTRDPAGFDRLATYLSACGVRTASPESPVVLPPQPEHTLLSLLEPA